MRMVWRPVALLASFTLLLVGGALALGSSPCGHARVHAYLGTAAPGELPTLLADPRCPDGDAALGLGGAFLAADHHRGPVCVADDVFAGVTFALARDANGDGAITPDVTGDGLEGPYTAGRCVEVPFAPGADGGWWVLIQGDGTRGTITS